MFTPPDVTSPPCDDYIEDGKRYTLANAQLHSKRATKIADFVTTDCPQMAYDSRGKITPLPLRVPIGNLKSAACRIDGVDNFIQEIVFAARPPTGHLAAIDYTFALKTTQHDYAIDHAVFLRWLDTVRMVGTR